jgi:hypothetical protein
MFPQDVPEVEPPIGTVAIFNSSFESGAGSSSNMMLRTEEGWTERPGKWQDSRTWQELTDLDYRNAEVQRRNPGSSSKWVTVQVQIIAQPEQKPRPAAEEPSYMLFARANVRDGMNSGPTVVNELLKRIDRLEGK